MTSSIFFLWTILSRDDPQNFSYWSDAAFYICNYDIITKAPMTSLKKGNHIFPWGVLAMCQVSIFPWCGFRDTEVQSFSVFPTWLSHQVTEYITIMIKTFYMSSRTDGENFVSIWQAVVEENTTVLCGQTNQQTKKIMLSTTLGELVDLSVWWSKL